jgi:hypothetical protein
MSQPQLPSPPKNPDAPLSKSERKMWEDAERLIEELSEQLDEKEHQIKLLSECERQIIIIPADTPVIHKLNFKEMHYTLYPLSMPQHFADDDTIEFNRVIVVSRREPDKEYGWGGQTLFLDDGAIVEGQTAKAWFVRLGYIKYDLNEVIPLVYCFCTIKDVQHLLDLVVEANAIVSIREEVLARLVLDMKNNFNKFQAIIDTATDFKEKAERREELLRKQVRTDLVRLDNNIEEAIDSNKIKMSAWQVVVLALGWVGFLVSFGFLFR